MSRSYRHIQEYEKEILKLREEGLTLQQIANRLGFERVQLKNFINRYNKRQAKISAGKVIKRKGRPPKDYAVSEQDKVAELKYILARKEARTKTLEMENELMRDFLSREERK